MNFTDLNFVLFLFTVILVYCLHDSSFYRKIVLFLSGYAFYALWNWKYIPLLLGASLIDFYCAMKIANSKNKNFFLFLSVSFNLSLLFIFKYYNFFISFLNPDLKIINLVIPVGLSFYTFQSMSYTIDVYRNKESLEKDLTNYLMFTSFFPQLVAGPIERAGHLIPQLNNLFELNYENARSGFQLILFGYFKKLVIADRLALIVDNFYINISKFSGLDAWIAIFAYSMQIYFDFSSYTDIARGVARIFNISLVENFNLPYWTISITDFWKKWHMSLTNWFRDYLFYPLVFSNAIKLSLFVVTLLVFALSGFWHGANWTFLLWGAVNGFILFIESYYLRYLYQLANNKFFRIILIVVNFILISFLWVFFRSNSLAIIRDVFSNLLDFNFKTTKLFQSYDYFLLVMILFSELIIKYNVLDKGSFLNRRIYFRWAFYIIMVVMIVFLGEYKTRPYIYFQF